MKQTIARLRVWVERLKLPAFLAAFFLSGALASITLANWHYDKVINRIHGSYGGRISGLNKEIRRVQKDLSEEREITRVQLGGLAEHLSNQAGDLDKLSDDVARLLVFARDISGTAQQAAATAKSAATTAQGAAANAAKATIQITEEPAEPEAAGPARPPKWTETP